MTADKASSTPRAPSPESTGGKGNDFELRVMTFFVVFMLTGIPVPVCTNWPIKKILLQGRKSGFMVDDVIIFVAHEDQECKLLGEIKSKVKVSRDGEFKKFLSNAWKDFTNPDVFCEGDWIVLFVGGMSSDDKNAIDWLLSEAEESLREEDFYHRISEGPQSTESRRKRMGHVRSCLEQAKKEPLTDAEFYRFLRSFRVLSIDVQEKAGWVPLIDSCMRQFNLKLQPNLVRDRVQAYLGRQNWRGAEISKEKIQKDLPDVYASFEAVPVDQAPASRERTAVEGVEAIDWTGIEVKEDLMQLALVGEWSQENADDLRVLRGLMGASDVGEVLERAQRALGFPDTPLSVQDGHWGIERGRRVKLLATLGGHLHLDVLDRFMLLAVSVLREEDAVAGLPVAKALTKDLGLRKSFKHSIGLRSGLADGLAMLSNHVEACQRLSPDAVHSRVTGAVRDILADASPRLWRSLSGLLHTLAEAAPTEFLNQVEEAQKATPCPLDDLLQETKGDGLVMGSPPLPGLLDALEGLAWDGQCFGRACKALGRLGGRDPGGRTYDNSPVSSLTCILMPWSPKTLASMEQRKGIVSSLADLSEAVTWDVLLGLLPAEHQLSWGTREPFWRREVADAVVAADDGITHGEYKEQIEAYAEAAVGLARGNAERLIALVDRVDHLPPTAYAHYLALLRPEEVAGLCEEERRAIWEKLTLYVIWKRRYRDDPSGVRELEGVLANLEPVGAIDRHHYLFQADTFPLHESDEWENEEKRVEKLRGEAVAELYSQGGMENVIGFASSVPSPWAVGWSLGGLPAVSIGPILLAELLKADDRKLRGFVEGLSRRMYQERGWSWCDGVKDRQRPWGARQKGMLLSFMPFFEATWDRVEEWLGNDQREYWLRARVNTAEAGSLERAIEKLAEYGRHREAVRCAHGQSRYKDHE